MDIQQTDVHITLSAAELENLKNSIQFALENMDDEMYGDYRTAELSAFLDRLNGTS